VTAAPATRLRDSLTIAFLFLATGAFTLYQNARVTVLWDLSYLLDTSFRISLHQLPYRDFPFAHAPLTFLLHAAIIRIFGRVYLPHILFAALEAGLATLLTWRILLRLLQREKIVPQQEDAVLQQEDAVQKEVVVQKEDAVQKDEVVILAKPESPYLLSAQPTNRAFLLATLLAAPLIFLGIYGVYPHPIYDSDCILAVLLALALLQRANYSAPRNLLAGVFCVLPLFFKQNIGLPFLLITLATVAILALARRLQRASLAPQLWFFAGATIALAAALLLIHATFGLHNYLTWTILFAAQRRLPGIPLILDIYRQTSLLWTIPAALIALILLRQQGSGAPSMAQSHRDMPGSPPASLVGWMGGMRRRRVPHPFRVLSGMGGSQAASIIAFFLLAAPFLCTVVSLALATDPSDRAAQLLSLWPHLLILATVLAVYNLRPSLLTSKPGLTPFLPLILLATIHGAFLSQQLWGSTYALWPLLMLLIAALLMQVPTLARPLAIVIAATFLLCGSLYATSHERLGYIQLDGPLARATLPKLRGLTTPGPWLPAFEELIRTTNTEIPPNDAILLIPGENPFYFATGRTPQFPVLLFDPATNPYTPAQVLAQSRARNVRWLIVSRNLQLTAPPSPDLPDILRALQPGFTLVRALPNYDIYRRN
jgi:hypothetical protein